MIRKIKYLLRKLDRKIREFIRYVTGASANIGTIIDTYNWVRLRLWDRYDKVKMRACDPGYYEPDNRILHASMELVLQFVENNKPYTDIDLDGHNKEAYDTILDLYVWYKWERHRDWNRYHDYLTFVMDKNRKHDVITKTEESVDGEKIKIKEKVLAEPKNINRFKKKRYEAESRELQKMEIRLHEKDKKMLKKLADVRRFMWT
jgi:hypothetical protein